MRRFLLALCTIAPAWLSGGALADDYYGSPHERGGHYGGHGYGGNQNAYRPDFYADFYRRYLVFLRECRQHFNFHRELRALRDTSPYGYGDPYEARDEREALRATHDLWHRDHPYATYCPSYRQYHGWAQSRGRQAWGEGYGWGGYRSDYWAR
jgi:hypothetical protein